MGERIEELPKNGEPMCIAFTPKVNEWNGYRSVEMEIVDFQVGSIAKLG
jgi:single-stranded-DNA-specific exonuclease